MVGQFLSIDPELNATGQAYLYVGDDPLNNIDPLGLWGWNPISDIKELATDVGHQTARHWRGIAQVGVTVGTGVGMGACIALTEGLCTVFTPFAGGLAGIANTAIGGDLSANGLTRGFAEGGIVGSLALLCAAVSAVPRWRQRARILRSEPAKVSSITRRLKVAIRLGDTSRMPRAAH